MLACSSDWPTAVVGVAMFAALGFVVWRGTR